MEKELGGGEMAYHKAECIIKETDHKGDSYRDENDDERMRERRPIARPDDVGELFAHMLQIGEW